MKKRIIALFMFLCLSFLFIVPSTVFADTLTFEFPDEPVINGLPSGYTAENIAAEIYDNDSLAGFGYTSNNSYFFVNYNSFDNSYNLYVVFEDDIVYDVVGKSFYGGQYRQFPIAIFAQGVKSTAYGLANLSNCTFTSFTSVPTGNNTTYAICQPNYVEGSWKQYMVTSFYYDSYYGFYNSSELNYNRGYCFGTYILPPFNPDKGYYEYYYNGVQLSFDPDDFYNWIINNNKLVELPSYIVQSKLLSFLNFYKDYGGSSTSFFRYVPQWFNYMSISGQTSDNINVLKTSTDKLYREYQTYLSSNHAYWPGAVKLEKRNNIDTLTDNDNTTLITDKQTDDDITLILRDILRGVIAIPNQIYVTGQDIINAIRQLDLSVNLTNDGGVDAPDLSELWRYDSNIFQDDLQSFVDGVEDVQNIPQGYINTINQNALMPENMLSDKNSLTVNVPCITGFTIGNNGSTYSTQTGTYTLNSSEYPWLDTAVKKIKRFASIILIIGYLVHLRYRIPEIIRGE